jgi:hypothetical protein
MQLNQPLDRLRCHLLRRGLPGHYVSRAVQELADHHADLVEAESGENAVSEEAAWQRLGNVEQLGDELVRKYRATSFAGRHPLLTFVIAPLPVMILFWTAMFLVGWLTVFGIVAPLFGWRLGQTVAEMKPLLVWIILTCHYGILVLPPAMVALWFYRLARRSGQGLAWTVPACLVAALFAFTFVNDMRLPYESLRGRLVWGFGFPVPESFQGLPMFWLIRPFVGLSRLWRLQGQVVQTLLPLAVMAYAAWRAHSDKASHRAVVVGERSIAC